MREYLHIKQIFSFHRVSSPSNATERMTSNQKTTVSNDIVGFTTLDTEMSRSGNALTHPPNTEGVIPTPLQKGTLYIDMN